MKYKSLLTHFLERIKLSPKHKKSAREPRDAVSLLISCAVRVPRYISANAVEFFVA